MTLMAKVNGVTYTMGLSSLVELPGGRTIEPQPGVSPRGGLGWTCLPHFCQRLFLRLMQIREFLRGGGRSGLELDSLTPYLNFKVAVLEFAY